MTETLAQHVQRSALGAPVELFQIDTAIYGGPIYYLVNDTRPGGVTFDGNDYSPLSISSDGWKVSSRGSLPRPRVSIGNATGIFSGLNLLYSDFVGCPVTRIVTFEAFLDGQPDADPEQKFPPDVYVIARKTHQDNVMVSYELAAAMDLSGRSLPGRQMLQGACPHRYRVWDGSAFDYTDASCPYAGATYFRRNGQSTGNASEDQCGKRVADCIARFGVSQDLPFWGFPGIDRVR